MPQTSSPYAVADYLRIGLPKWAARRSSVVPGDYSLGLLDHVIAHPTVAWVGCSNERSR